MKHNKIALTIDIEDWHHTPAVTGSPFAHFKDVQTFMSEWKDRYDYISESTRRLLDILKEYDLKATFFIVADIIEYYPGLVEKICNGGHEIACHGLHHAIAIDPTTKKPLFTVAEFEDRILKSKTILEKATGQPIIGYRAPGAYIGDWMLDSLLKLGFKYDSSINPNSFIKKTNFCTKNISSSPYIVRSNDNNKLYEIPWSYFKVAGMRFPTGGGPFLRFMPFQYIKHGIKQSLKRGDTVLYFHSLDITYEKLPALASNNSKRPFYFVTSGKKTEKKMRKLLKQFHNQWSLAKDIYESNL